MKLTCIIQIYKSIFSIKNDIKSRNILFTGSHKCFLMYCVLWRKIFKAYCYEFVNIVCKICIYYLFLNYNISDAREIFIFGEKARDFS